VKRYTDREKTKLEHAWEIQREYRLTPFAEVEPELTAWIADQAWMTGEGSEVTVLRGGGVAARPPGPDARGRHDVGKDGRHWS